MNIIKCYGYEFTFNNDMILNIKQINDFYDCFENYDLTQEKYIIFLKELFKNHKILSYYDDNDEANLILFINRLLYNYNISQKELNIVKDISFSGEIILEDHTNIKPEILYNISSYYTLGYYF